MYELTLIMKDVHIEVVIEVVRLDSTWVTGQQQAVAIIACSDFDRLVGFATGYELVEVTVANHGRLRQFTLQVALPDGTPLYLRAEKALPPGINCTHCHSWFYGDQATYTREHGYLCSECYATLVEVEATP